MRRVTPSLLALCALTMSCSPNRGAEGAKMAEVQDRYAQAEFDEPAMEAMPEPKMSEAEEKREEEAPLAKNKDKADSKEGEGGDTKKKTWKRSRSEANTSTVMVGDDEELPIRGAQIFAKADGYRARVLVDFYFVNDKDRQLEGTFKARLPDGATPYMIAFGGSKVELTEGMDAAALEAAGAYVKPADAKKQALDPVGAMAARQASWIDPREGRMTPRVAARRAFDRRVTQRIDPALMEWSGPGVFTARLFPLEPNTVHKVVLGYDVDLERVGDDLQLDVPLPAGVPAVAVDLDVGATKGLELTPKPASSADVDGRRYASWRAPKGDLIRARFGAPGPVTLTDGELFAARVTPDLPARKAGGAGAAVFMVDTSMSSNPDAYNIYLALLEKTLEANRDQMKRFGAVFFDVDARWWREEFVENTPENVAALMAHARSQALEGATDLGGALRAVAQRSFEVGAGADVFLLSDGAATWGESDRWVMSTLARSEAVGALFAYRTGLSGADNATLGHLARELGGAVFSVTGEDQLEAASRAHRDRPWRLIKVESGALTDLLLAGRPQALYPGQRLELVGRGAPTKDAKVTFVVEQGADRRTIEVPLGKPRASELATRAFGEVAVAQLEELVDATRDNAGAYARHFRVVGKTTSLLMLETDEEYAEFAIDPEADAELVATTQVSVMVLHALDALTARLGDARAALMNELERLKTTPGVNLELPATLTGALGALTAGDLSMPTAPLVAKQVPRAELPKAWRDQLTKRKPEYDAGYAEAARRLKELGAPAALKALSSLVEGRPGDAVLARDVAFWAMEHGLDGQAAYLLRRVATQRPDEPQTYHALARALDAAGAHPLALAYYEVGIRGGWDARFGEFQAILAQDYLRFLRDRTDGLPGELREYATKRKGEIAAIVGISKADVVVTIMWNTDRTDVDLHVIEPSGEECYYSHPNTKSGGRLTQDVTQGYGPEMYVLEKAPKGKYAVKAKYFSSDRSRLTTRTKVYATVTRGWGTKEERVERKVVSLADGEEMHEILNLDVK